MMNKEVVMGKLNEIFRDVFDDEDIVITDVTTANDIEDWDSLTHLQLISIIEKNFKVHFSLGEINSFANVDDMCNCILKHMEK